ncbi:uncharacterized protein LOC143615370 [Bidens hawaiensis]|uniref:uncharacterized protein LOC143615370 n=1 Tax=Bidens hawaiensis TaxID=980011 RepID=UPI00404ACC1F
MESDDDYESFSIPISPSPSPKHRRLKRLKKSTDVAVKSTTGEPVPEEALEASDIHTFDGNGNGDELCPRVNGNDDSKVKELRSCYDNLTVKDDLEIEDDDVTEKELSSGGDEVVRTDRKETKRALDFDDDDDVINVKVNESGVDQLAGDGGDNIDMEVRADEDVENNEKKGKKKRRKSSGDGDEPKAKTSYSSKRREEKERRAYLDQLHAESQRILRETRGVSFKPVPLVQKPISSILEKIRQRKLEMSKKFNQSNNDDFDKEGDKYDVKDQPESVEKEVNDLSESVKEDNVSNVMNVDHVSDDDGTDEPDLCKEPKSDVNACSQKDLDVDPTPAIRAPVDDTQELFGDTQTSDGKESENEESCEHDSSSQEEEMGPSLLTMKLKFDSVPDDTCDEEENDKENVDPHVQEHPSRGDHAKAFLDDEAEEEDDGDNDRMVFGDDDEDEDEDEDEDDIEELNKMIATGYKERPIDLETRNELHQKWLEEKDAAGTDDLLRRLNVTSKLKEASLLDDDEGEEDVEMNDNGNDDIDNGDEDDVDVHEDENVERPRRMNLKKAKEMVAQMFNDKDDDYFSSDEEETEKILVKEHLCNKDTEKGKLVSPVEDEDSREVFGLIKKLNEVPEGRKKAKIASHVDTILIGGNNNSSSKSSFLSRMSNNSVSLPSKQGGSGGVRSFIFGRDDSNSRSSILNSEDTSDAIASSEMQPKKVTTKYRSSQSQGRSSTQSTNLVSESSSTSFFEILNQSSLQSNVHNQHHKIEISQSVFASFKIPKKPIKIQGRV